MQKNAQKCKNAQSKFVCEKLCYNAIYVKNVICDNSPMQEICEKKEKFKKSEKYKNFSLFSQFAAIFL